MLQAASCLLLCVAVLGCGAGGAGGVPAAGERSDGAAAQRLAPNELRARAELGLRTPRSEEGELTTFEVPLTRYIGPFAKNGSSG